MGYRTFSVTTSLDGIAKDRGVDLANMALYACRWIDQCLNFICDLSVFIELSLNYSTVFFASLMRRHGTNEANKKLVRLELDLVAKGLSKGEIYLSPYFYVHANLPSFSFIACKTEG